MSMSEKQAMLALQNGSDIRGIAISTPQQEVTLTVERTKKIGQAFITWLQKRVPGKELTVAIGMDSRISGPDLKQALFEGMAHAAVTIIDCGMATTPAMFMATLYDDFRVDGAIMITASHLPFQYNGLKFFTATGGAEHEDIDEILELATESAFQAGNQAVIVEKDLLTVYAEDLVGKIREGIDAGFKPLEGKHIVVDAGNGAGGFFVEKVLQPLGANTTGSQFLEPDGMFPNHESNPDNKVAMQALKDAVLSNQADLGIIFDTDVDRSALVDSQGQALNRNNLIALISAVLLKEQPGATIVTNSATSQHVEDFIVGLGGKQDRYLTGYRNVINRAIALDAALAIETSGHAALKENYYLDDGAYLVAKLLMANTDLPALIKDLKQPEETTEYRFVIVEEPIQENGLAVIDRFKAFLAEQADIQLIPDHLEGVRANFADGWFILRMSLHEPLLVWTLESDKAGEITPLVEQIMPFFMEQGALDRENIIRK
ncbi:MULTISPECIES: phosphomannomutase/phosphoglucomutase [unclassified Jeotgalibaca]|uniref:phosphomannomutase/phosphoglucomutase n=1 Tax=unclassified Jeotgalibaca TaxID=2621505 RepID=UPI003FD1E7A9